MTSDALRTDEQGTRERMESAAQAICDQNRNQGATWEWLNEKSLRIWNFDGSPLMTLHMERLS